MTLNDELLVIDETISELETRRTQIIHLMEANSRSAAAAAKTGTNIINFPARATVVETGYSASRHIW
jgi:hypothetical protein